MRRDPLAETFLQGPVVSLPSWACGIILPLLEAPRVSSRTPVPALDLYGTIPSPRGCPP